MPSTSDARLETTLTVVSADDLSEHGLNLLFQAIPRDNSNDRDPMWVGEKVYFASDRKGPFGLFSYDLRSRSVAEEVRGSGFDIKSASAGPGGIVYEKFGSIHLFDPVLRSEHVVPITIAGDFPEVRPQIKNLTQYINNVDISPSGKRAVFEARGRIFTVPAEKGDVHQIAIRQGVAERSPAWSPDGNTIAFLSDESGEYKLVLHDMTNAAERSLDLGDAPAGYGSLIWSPDSKHIAYTDNRHIIWLIDVGNGKNTKIDTATYEAPSPQIGLSWSPDNNWIAFNRDLDNHLNALFLYSLDARKTTQITDGLSNVRYPVFDRGGKYLYFTASTNTGPRAGWLDLSSNTVLNVVSRVYAMTLAKDTPDPLQPESDEERPGEDKARVEKAKEARKPGFHIDLDGIDQRAVALPMPELDYSGLVAGPEGTLFALSTSLAANRLGYVHIPDTSVGGWSNFMRYYYSQVQKDGMVIDERSNHGGAEDDYMVEAMSRPMASMTATRYGRDFPSPAASNFGPKVLIIDQYSGSGGDQFPWHFKHAHVGPLIGKQTYGALVGTLASVTFVDGGYVTTPNLAFYNPNGTWDVENHGVDPDIDVDLDPYQWRQGHDSQLESAVQEAMKLLESKPKPLIKRPAYRDKSTLQKAEQRG